MKIKGDILIILCSDKMFPVLGFGAKLSGGSVSHEFAVVSSCRLSSVN